MLVTLFASGLGESAGKGQGIAGDPKTLNPATLNPRPHHVPQSLCEDLSQWRREDGREGLYCLEGFRE